MAREKSSELGVRMVNIFFFFLFLIACIRIPTGIQKVSENGFNFAVLWIWIQIRMDPDSAKSERAYK